MLSDGAWVAAESNGVASGAAAAAPTAALPAIPVALANAALLTTIGSCLGGHLLYVLGIPVTAGACVLAWTIAVRRRSETVRARWWTSFAVAGALLSVAAAIGLVAPSPQGPAWYEALYRAHPAIALVTIGIAVADNAAWRRRAVLVTTATAVLLQLLAPLAVPHPVVDVWSWGQTCGSTLLAGVHPYTVVAPDPYHGAYDFGSAPSVFPYMPGLLLAAAAAIALLGDYRYAIALCLPLTVWLLWTTASRLRVDERLIALLTLALVVHPRLTLMTTNGFAEPLLVVAIAAFAYFSVTRRDTAAAVAFFAVPSIKQYFVAPLVLLALPRPRRRAVAIGAAVAVAVALPFAIWNARATLAGMLFFVRAPLGFREDADSVAALVAHVLGRQAPASLAIAAQFAAAGAARWLLPGRGAAGLLLASALALGTCFLVAPQAFFYYYAFVAAILLFSALLFAGDGEAACA